MEWLSKPVADLASSLKLTILLSYAAPYRKSLIFCGAAIVIETAIALGLPWLGGHFAGIVLAADGSEVGEILFVVLALFASQALLKFTSGYALSRTTEQTLCDLRIRIYDHLQALCTHDL